jgi:RNA polymerase sigma-70 factor, ECF subfamily
MDFSKRAGLGHMTEAQTESVTRLLIELTRGNHAAVDALLPLIYDELRSLAANYLRRERPDHTLQPTALVHEAYLRMVDQTRVNWQNRAHFFGVAAQMMRRILVDHARAHKAGKRGADFQKFSLDENIDKAVERSSELIALDDALQELAEIDEQKSRIIELLNCATSAASPLKRRPKCWAWRPIRSSATGAWPRHGSTVICKTSDDRCVVS